MGAGASTTGKGKGKGKAETAGGAKALSTAGKGGDKAAKALFDKIDTDANGKVSLEELKTAIAKGATDLQPTWNDDQLELTVNFFDRDGDGELNLDEFKSVLAELAMRSADDKGGAAAAASIAERAKKRKAHAAIFDKYKGESGMERKHMVKVLRDINDAQGIWDNDSFGPYLKAQWEELAKTDDKTAIANLNQFCAWYPSVEKTVEDVIKQWAKEDAEREAAKAAAKAASAPKFEGETWQCPMSKLQDALVQAFNMGKTPLLIDVTGDKSEPFTPLETFYGYSGDAIVELKKGVVEVSMKKEKSMEELQAEYGQVLCRALKQGLNLTLLCSNAAPPFTSKMASPTMLPIELLDATKLQALFEANAFEGSFLADFVKWAGDTEWGKGPSYSLLLPNDKFRVVVVTKFSPDDYKDFLSDEWPLSQMQPVRVFAES